MQKKSPASRNSGLFENYLFLVVRIYFFKLATSSLMINAIVGSAFAAAWSTSSRDIFLILNFPLVGNLNSAEDLFWHFFFLLNCELLLCYKNFGTFF